MSRRLVTALIVTGALSGLLAAVALRPNLPSALPKVLGGSDSGAKAVSATSDPFVHIVAKAIGKELPIYRDASDSAPPTMKLPNPGEYGVPVVVLVQTEKGGWLNVLLPVRPNGSTGWIRATDVTTSKHEFRIEVELSAHRLTVYHRDGVFLQESVGVGRGPTPTPLGVFYTKELLQPPNPNTAYGAYAYGLSGYSNVLTDFAGGDGIVGIHGTNDPATLGTDVSHGCIRMSNAGITRLAKSLPLGVPVVIRP
ncbi:MAG TPA: L,D-transpeptidase family protein [Acidimicrobiales bacterium]|nr:L,D-transpeptidase family protein [Acidimicrobiales bacterium]